MPVIYTDFICLRATVYVLPPKNKIRILTFNNRKCSRFFFKKVLLKLVHPLNTYHNTL
jgi:hypothetical protein